MRVAATRSGWPSLAISALPKLVCPVCSPGYAAVLPSLGVGFLTSTTYLLPTTGVMLALAVAALRQRTTKHRRAAPFWIGVFASVCILAGKFWFEFAAMTYSGIAVLAIASVWNVMSKRSRANRCSHGVQPACASRNRKTNPDEEEDQDGTDD